MCRAGGPEKDRRRPVTQVAQVLDQRVARRAGAVVVSLIERRLVSFPRSTLIGVLAPEFPNPLIDLAGQPVTDVGTWSAHRAVELWKLFQDHVYGTWPDLPVSWQVEEPDEPGNVLGGRALARRIMLVASSAELRVPLLLLVPAHAAGPSPCFLGLTLWGNDRALAGAERFAEAPDDPEAPQGMPLSEVLDRGYAVALVEGGAIVPDDPRAAVEALIRLQPGDAAERTPTGTGALAAWAWGLCRTLDYLATQPAIDVGRVAVFGHSRLGKTALVAMAADPRIALGVISQSGTGGAAPWRLAPEAAEGAHAAESLTAIVTRFPHWFCPALAAYVDNPDALPVEANELLALCAPRPVLLSGGADEYWTNTAGTWDMRHEALPVYRLFGAVTGDEAVAPPLEVLDDGPLGWFNRPGGHAIYLQDWHAWLDYADRWLGAPTNREA